MVSSRQAVQMLSPAGSATAPERKPPVRVPQCAEFLPLDLAQNGNSVVSTNSDSTVDIAVVPALPAIDIFDFKVVPDDMLTTKDSFAALHIGEGSDVFFAGLFVSYYGERKNNPILRFGRVAMLPEDRIRCGAR